MNDNSNSLGIFTEKVTLLMCPECEAELDVSEFDVFEEIACPSCGASITVPGRLGDFILIEELGRGAMGCVYLAMDESLNRLVALKVIRKEYGSDPKMLESVQREAQAMATLNHRNIVQVYSFGRIREQPFFVMELLQGERLDEMMQGGAQISEIRALEIAIDVAQGLDAANNAGLTHGDIKPANILMNEKGVAKVVDFGLAKFMEPGQEIEVWGTPYYIAPEKAKKKGEDSRSDQYSLGGTIFHALAGHPPFDAESPTKVVVAALKQDTPLLSESNPDITPKTDQVIRRMMDKNPNRRYPTYASLLADLQQALTEARQAEEQKKLEEQRRLEKENKKTNPLLITMLAVSALVIAGVGAAVLLSGRGGNTETVQQYPGPQREAGVPFLRAEERNLSEAVEALTAGNLSAAEERLSVANNLIPEDHVAMGWSKFLEAGMWMYAQYPERARELIEEVAAMDGMIFDTKGTPDEDPRILARVALGEMDARDLQRALRRVQPYYGHLAELALGYQKMLEDDRNSAARHFRAYSEYRTPGMVWPYVLRSLAPQLHLPLKQLVPEEVKEQARERLASEILAGIGTRTRDGKPLFKISPVREGTKVDFASVKNPSWVKSEAVASTFATIPSGHILTNASGVQPLPGREFTVMVTAVIPAKTDGKEGSGFVLVHFGGVTAFDDPENTPAGLVVELSLISGTQSSLRIRAGTGEARTLLQSLATIEAKPGEIKTFALSWDGSGGGQGADLVLAMDGRVLGSVKVEESALPASKNLNVVAIGSGIGKGGALNWGGGIQVRRMFIFDRALTRSELGAVQQNLQ